MKQRFLSAFLALALCLSLLPTAALANNASEPDPGGGSIAEITVTLRESSQETTTTEYSSTTGAFATAFENTSVSKIKLLKDVTLTTDDFDFYTAYVEGTLVLDLNGHALKFSPDVEIQKSGTLTVTLPL